MDFLDKKIEEEVNNKVIPGMTYAVIKDGKINLGSNGFKEIIPFPIENDIETKYDIASLTKVVVTLTLVSKLFDNKLIDFNDKLKKYLPKFKYDDITIFQLLTHTSGLPADLNDKKIRSKKEIIDKIYNLNKEYETGSKIVYSDVGYILLGMMIEEIYNNKLDLIAKKEIFEPLEMYNTCYNPKDIDSCAATEITDNRGIVKGFVHDEKAYSLGGVAGHAGVFSTANDLSNFVFMILNDGIYKDKKFLSKEIIDMWFKPIIYDEKNECYRSFSFIVGNNIISFNGFTGPSISIDRDNNLGIVLMTNRIHPSRDNKLISEERPKISNEIYKQLLKVK